VRTVVANIKKYGFYPPTLVTEGLSSEPEVLVEGHAVTSFASANYLGLANDPRVKKAVIDGIERYGLHPTGARLVSGSLDVHRELERRTAEFKGTEDAMLFATGVLANLGVIPGIMSTQLMGFSSHIREGVEHRKAAIFSDELNHASVIDGNRLSRADVVTYKHKDMDDLAAKMQKYRSYRKMIVTDGVFSMDGDIAPPPALIEIARLYEAILMVDDAHATGVLGERGKGTLEHFGLSDGVDVNMGTYSKALGVAGGFVAGEHELIEYLRVAARTYMFSGATFGSLALGAMTALEISEHEPERRHRLWASSRRLRDRLVAQGLNVLGTGETPIVPVVIGEESAGQAVSYELFQTGFFAPCIAFPAVEKGQCRVRLTVTSLHTDEQIDGLVTALGDICKRRGLLQTT
jgi:8-amino-7-oxononanoate synthase